MAGCRENANIWWMLSHRPPWPGARWYGWRVFERTFWRSEYIWHDSVGKFWARALTCRFFGHLPLRQVNDPGEPRRMHCFRCERSEYPDGQA